MAHKILLVDDDQLITKVLKRFLESRSFSVVTANNGADALTLTKEILPDLVLSDAEMPGLDGHSLCRILRKEASTHSIPMIIMSGARIQDSNIVAGFEEGADDYILKPLSMPVLMARIEAVLRRTDKTGGARKSLNKCGVELCPEARTVKVNGQKITFTRKEFDLLAILIAKSPRVLGIPYLLETVWGYDPGDYNDPGTVEAHISHLRKKLGPVLAKKIVNITGHGYKFEDEE